VQWFKLHRHFNQDVLLMTQSFRDIASEIAGLLAMLIRCRKADILGRKDAYIRKVFSGFRGSEVSREERKYLPQYFQLYRSHTQGMSVGEASATDVKPFIVKWRRFTWAWWVFAVVFAVWAFWPSKGKPVIPRKAQAPVQRGSAVAATGTGAPVIAARGAGSPAPAASQPGQQEDPEPYAGKDIHIAGRLVGADGRAIYVLTVSDKGRRLFDMTAQDLKDAGYSYEALNACAGYVRRGSKARAVTCDAPILAAGSNDRPIVVGQPVAVSDRRGMATGLPSGEGGGGVVVVGAGSAPVWGYDPDKASAPVQSVFSRSSGK
jgi:zona occludens toxin